MISMEFILLRKFGKLWIKIIYVLNVVFLLKEEVRVNKPNVQILQGIVTTVIPKNITTYFAISQDNQYHLRLVFQILHHLLEERNCEMTQGLNLLEVEVMSY